MILRYALTSDQKRVVKSLVKVFVASASAWLATSPLEGEVRLAVAAAIAAVANALYSWFDPQDTRYGKYE